MPRAVTASCRSRQRRRTNADSICGHIDRIDIDTRQMWGLFSSVARVGFGEVVEPGSRSGEDSTLHVRNGRRAGSGSRGGLSPSGHCLLGCLDEVFRCAVHLLQFRRGQVLVGVGSFVLQVQQSAQMPFGSVVGTFE